MILNRLETRHGKDSCKTEKLELIQVQLWDYNNEPNKHADSPCLTLYPCDLEET